MIKGYSDIPKGRYILLGASGLMGYHTLNLLKDCKDVSVLAVSGTRPLRVSAPHIRSVRANLTDASICERLFRECDYALIFAGVVASTPVLSRDPIGPIQNNLKIAINCLEAAWRNKVRHSVWLGSTTGYPAAEQGRRISEDQMFEGEPPGNWYALGWMTRYVEKFAQHLAENVSDPVPVTVLRPSMIYGENDHFDDENAHFLPALIRRVVQRENPIEVWGNGEQVRDVIHAEDVVHAAFSTINMRSQGFAAYNVAFGKSYSVNYILDLITSIDNFNEVEIEHRLQKTQSAASLTFSTEKAQAEIGFEARIGIKEGLTRTISWYRGATNSEISLRKKI